MINSSIDLGLIMCFKEMNKYKLDFYNNNKYHADFNIDNYNFDFDFI